jgi:multiphosphoryl transfer protein
VVVRLFDGGGDKPLPWLPAPDGSSDRGIALLLRHPRLLDAQLRAILRAAADGDLRVLVPFVERASDVAEIRARTKSRLPVGALVETPEAVARIDEIAAVADFLSIGTNDLSATLLGEGRARAGLSLDPGLLRLVERAIGSAHRHARVVTVCGELAGDAHGARVLVGLGANALSVAPSRIAPVKVALRNTSIEDCRAIARAAIGGAPAP